jgi:glycerol-3-phosphate acyltransferase PlsX
VAAGAATVALDALGADDGVGPIVAGARTAASEGIRLRVFGRPGELGGLKGVEGVELIEAPGEITNDEEPLPAVRARPEASIVAAARDVAEGRSQAVVSAGATGATMAAATFGIKRLQGVQRPALAVEIPSPMRPGRPVLLLDVGASTEARAQHLVQFAHLGSAFARVVLGVESPRVALLSVGEEAKKGNPTVVEAHEMLAADLSLRGQTPGGQSPLMEFAGNVEGRDLLRGDADVVVTDGFTGNVTLKTIEGTAKAVADAVRGAARSNPLAAAGGLLLRPALGGLRRELDPDTTGGAVLLGLRRVTVVAHGSSGPEGIANAIRLAHRAVRERAIERTAEQLERAGAGRGALRNPAGPDA